MFATIMRSNALEGDRQTVVIPLQDKVRVFTRVGSGRGISGAWKEELPVMTNENVIGNSTAITMTANDYRDLQFPITPTTLLQKLVRTFDSDVVTSKDATDEFAELYGKAKANPLSLAMYLKGANTQPVSTTPVVETPPVVDEEVVETLTKLDTMYEEVREYINVYDEVKEYIDKEKEEVNTLTTIAPLSNHDTVLTVPDVQPYFARTFDGLSESEVYDYARKTQQNVLLTGEAGTGKTSSARNYSAMNKLPFVTIECTQQIDQSVTQGRFVPTGVGNATQWRYSQLATAIQQPSIVLLNELTRMTPKAASLFLRLLEERELLIEPLNEVIKVHPECLFIADQNTGLGYTGTSKQDAALIDRFNIKLEFKYDTTIESKFIKSPALLEFASNIREASEMNDEFSIPMSTRVLQNFQAQATSLNFAFAVHSLLANFPKSDGERDAIKMRLDAEIDRVASDYGVELGNYNK
jgi:MoxR-like ATPase